MSERLYLAGPYGSSSREEQTDRLVHHVIAAGLLMKAGHLVFSPISHSGLIVGIMEDHLHDTREFWLHQCDSYIHNWATRIIVLPLDGWEASIGTKHEINLAEMLNKPVVVSWNLKKAVDLYLSDEDKARSRMTTDINYLRSLEIDQ